MTDEPRSTDPTEPDVPAPEAPAASDSSGPEDPAAATGPSAPAGPPVEARPITVLRYALPSGWLTYGAAWLKRVKGPPQPPVLSIPTVFVMLLVVGVVYLCAGGAGYLALRKSGVEDDATSIQVTLILTQWFVFLILPLAWVSAARANLRLTYSWRRPRWDLTILTVAMTLCLVGTIQYVGDLAVMYLAEPYDRLLNGYLPSTTDRVTEAAKLFEADTFSELMLAILLAAVTPAICEEHFFRGAIQSSLDKRIPPVAAVLVVATIFGAFHLEPVGFSALLLIGLMVGVFTTRTGCILYACVVHLANNTMSVLVHNWALKNVDDLQTHAGSFDSFPIYLVGGAVGMLAFLVRTPRRRRRRWRDQVVPDDPAVFRPGRWHRWSALAARRWRLAVVIAAACSAWGFALDIRDLREIAAASKTQPADDVDEGENGRRRHQRQEDGPDRMPPRQREQPEAIHVDAGDHARQRRTDTRAAVHRLPGAPGPLTMGRSPRRSTTRSPTRTS